MNKQAEDHIVNSYLSKLRINHCKQIFTNISKISIIIKCSNLTIQLKPKSIYLQNCKHTVAIKLHTGMHISYHGPSVVGTITMCAVTANEVITYLNYTHTYSKNYQYKKMQTLVSFLYFIEKLFSFWLHLFRYMLVGMIRAAHLSESIVNLLSCSLLKQAE